MKRRDQPSLVIREANEPSEAALVAAARVWIEARRAELAEDAQRAKSDGPEKAAA